MREIKFRGKRLDAGEWAYGNLIIANVEPTLAMIEDGKLFRHMVDPKTVGQFTGLKDTNKTEPKEIYDKDILCCDDTNADYQTYAEVFWDDEYGMWKANHYDGDEVCEYELWSLLQEFRFVDVAGNTMETPELLKSETQETL